MRLRWLPAVLSGVCLPLVAAPAAPVEGGLSTGLAAQLAQLGMGLLVNRNYTVWDYRDRPWNLWGQICPLFTVLWIPIAFAAIFLYRVLNRQLESYKR